MLIQERKEKKEEDYKDFPKFKKFRNLVKILINNYILYPSYWEICMTQNIYRSWKCLEMRK